MMGAVYSILVEMGSLQSPEIAIWLGAMNSVLVEMGSLTSPEVAI
jgi:hypothetical protein